MEILYRKKRKKYKIFIKMIINLNHKLKDKEKNQVEKV
jgi:hypothetical protein